MKLLLTLILCLSQVFTDGWLVDFEKAKKLAHDEHKFILLNFSGSDWCGPCIQMHKEIFDRPAFQQFSAQSLVLVNADFPRAKKNHLPADQQKKNDLLAEQFNKKGVFPFTILLTSDGKQLSSWEGFPQGSVDDFIRQIQNAMHAGN